MVVHANCKHCGEEFSYEFCGGQKTLYCEDCKQEYSRIKQRKDGVSSERWKRIKNHTKIYLAQFQKYWETHDPYAETKEAICTKRGCSKRELPQSSSEFSRCNSNKNGLSTWCKQCGKDDYRRNLVKNMLSAAKQRATRCGIEFNLCEKDVVIPVQCPVLGIPIVVGERQHANSPSLDRWDNNKGYTADNCRVISWRANNLKGDATIEELERILTYMKGAN